METKEASIKIGDILSVYYGKVYIRIYDLSENNPSEACYSVGPIDSEEVNDEIRDYYVIDIFLGVIFPDKIGLASYGLWINAYKPV